MAFVPCWPVTQPGIVQSHHTKTNSGPPTADKRGWRGPEMDGDYQLLTTSSSDCPVVKYQGSHGGDFDHCHTADPIGVSNESLSRWQHARLASEQRPYYKNVDTKTLMCASRQPQATRRADMVRQVYHFPHLFTQPAPSLFPPLSLRCISPLVDTLIFPLRATL